MYYKHLGILMVICFIIMGCVGKTTDTNVTSSQNVPAEKAPKEKVNQPNNKEPTYIDESKYEGEELKLVQIINNSVKFQNDGDKDGYKELLAKESNFNFPSKKVRKIEVVNVTFPDEMSAMVTTKTWLEGNDDYVEGFYLFSKQGSLWKMVDKD